MGKDSKKRSGVRHDPLHVQIEKDTTVELHKPWRSKKPAQGTKSSAADDMDEDQPMMVDQKTSKRILDVIKKQQDEMEMEERTTSRRPGPPKGQVSKPVLASHESDEEEEDEDLDEDFPELDGLEEIEINEEEQTLMEKFMNRNPRKQMNLSDLIMSKIEAANQGAAPDDEDQAPVPPGLNPKVIEVYTKVGLLMSRYKSGKVPKTFKIIPSLANWEEILYLTSPESWTPHAVYQATRIFTSNLKAKMAQRFFSLVLLDRVREDIAETKKLNYHLYLSLKKALYKPAAFFKGLMLPLCESGNCTLREAAIIGSVLTKVSVPMLHSAAALLKLAEMDYTGPNSLFIRVLLDKKYALPFKVVDALVFHFLRFRNDQRQMPVLWHQSLLIFSQRYKEDITQEQKEALLDLLKYKSHEGITPEIRRELQNSTCRGDKVDDIDMTEALMDM
ncbi:Bystin-domain-containing protein [Polychytrium aggregatum]|uniref:Bystin-domain-containing protein n=1 Tax=Polychytrium aggregatum TaxID=110093 RepID=UPI0022FF120A|nr:Bystin-domain-containing protein [Polychytrium aggregatum]KAI9206217.1 Bystin-domain-containing protein [Polychytrium aggregatum]